MRVCVCVCSFACSLTLSLSRSHTHSRSIAYERSLGRCAARTRGRMVRDGPSRSHSNAAPFRQPLSPWAMYNMLRGVYTYIHMYVHRTPFTFSTRQKHPIVCVRTCRAEVFAGDGPNRTRTLPSARRWGSRWPSSASSSHSCSIASALFTSLVLTLAASSFFSAPATAAGSIMELVVFFFQKNFFTLFTPLPSFSLESLLHSGGKGW